MASRSNFQVIYEYDDATYTTTDSLVTISFDVVADIPSEPTTPTIRGAVFGTVYIQNLGTTNSLDYEIYQEGCLVTSGAIAANSAGDACVAYQIINVSKDMEIKYKSTSDSNSTTVKTAIRALGW